MTSKAETKRIATLAKQRHIKGIIWEGEGEDAVH